MNQTIKFRGFYKGVPHIFDFTKIIGDKQGNPCIIVDKDVWVSIHALENITRFTGIKDNNGVEIYEGDFIRDKKSPIIKEIVYINVGFFAQPVFFPSGKDYFYSDSCVIIGNIHQNPNLFKD